MAFSDWSVEVTKETEIIDNSINSETKARIYPDGFVVGKRVEMSLTHQPSGAVLVRVDNFVPYTLEGLLKYSRSVTQAFEGLKASGEFSALGAVDIVPVAVPQTDAQKALTSYQAAKAQYAQAVEFIAAAKEVKPESTATFDQKLADAQAVLDRAKKELAAQIEAGEIVKADAAAVAELKG